MKSQEVQNLVAWLKTDALPLWASAGWDAPSRQFVERLDLAGTPLLDQPRRAMVQARQIYVYCTAHRHGWFDGGHLAVAAGDTLMDRYSDDPGLNGFSFSLARDGSVHDAKRDLYGHAFVLLALAELARYTGSDRYLQIAHRTIAFLDNNMASAEHGGYAECVPDLGTPRRQNPHMHLLEAILALHDVDPAGGYLHGADRLVALFETRFMCGPEPVLIEFFDEAWQPTCGSDISFEPGHHFEWIWLLKRYEAASRRPELHLIDRLWQSATTCGVAADGTIYEEVRPNGVIIQGATRLWPYAEAAKAAVAMGGNPAFHADRFAATLKQRFLDPAPRGSWIDHYDASGQIVSPFAPASSLYHICCAASELWQAEARG